MWPRSRSNSSRGFTLTELLVTVAALIVVMTLSAQLLFATRRAADRQRLQTEPRQIARGATDYVNYLIRTATDLNNVGGARNPLALVTWFFKGDPDRNPALMQAAYNNLTATQTAAGIGDLGTDLITLAHSEDSRSVPMITWTGKQHSSTNYWEFNEGCPDSALNMQLFKELTGAHVEDTGADCTREAIAGCVSDVLFIVDTNGIGAYYQITDYKEGPNATNCSATNQLPDVSEGCRENQGCLGVVANPGRAEVNPPSGRPYLTPPITMGLGPKYFSLRVCNGWLEQKSGMFDADTDSNCVQGNFGTYTAKPRWAPLLNSVEDFQIAWVFNNGETRNGAVATRLTTTGQVPEQGQNPLTHPYDVTNVTGMRVTFTTVSGVVRTDAPAKTYQRALPGEVNERFFRPAAEDHDAATTRDKIFRYQLSATSMIRNRWVGM
jgi:type II secretory pathway pseudopilin PulG